MSDKRNSQPALFETVLRPAGNQTTPTSTAVPEVPDLVHLARGWRAAVRDLEGPGRRWLVTPWLTTRDADLLGSVQKGDRLLIRGHAQDFLTGMSDLDAVQAFMEWGVEVQRLPNLHAKVYAREYEDKGGVLWLGSANLSNTGENGGPRSKQIEAMSGPHPLTPNAQLTLENLWNASKLFSPSDIQRELARLVQERETSHALLLDQAEPGVVALRLSFRLLGGQFTIPPDWLGHGSEEAQKNGANYPSVDYIASDTSLATRFRKFFNAEKRSLGTQLEDVPGFAGLSVLRTEDMPGVKLFLSNLESRARERFEQDLRHERQYLLEDFKQRFERAFAPFLTEEKRHLAKTARQAALDATEVLDGYLDRDPFRITAQFFVPLKNAEDPSDGLVQAIAQLRARQRLL